MLKPDENDPNYVKEMKRFKEHPEDWGPIDGMIGGSRSVPSATEPKREDGKK